MGAFGSRSWAFFISGYVADAFTRVAHFGFVYEKGRRLVPRRL
jgi:hypothetical protein